MENVVRFWLGEVGVDGFRLDAVRHLIESGPQQSNTDATHAWLRQLRAFYNAIDARALTVGEVAGEPVDVMASYTLGDELDLTFDFGLASAFVSAARGGSAGLAGGQLGLTYKIMPPLQFATFLTNHDQPRLMTELRNNPDKVKVAASLLLTAPGVPFIYYGEEIGLQGGKPDELIRRPMQWSGEPQAGFTSGSAWIAPGPDWESLNVAAESADPGSILAHYRNLIAIRNQHAALRVGDLSTVGTGSRSLYAILRISSGEAILVLVNLTGTPIADYGLSVQESSLAPGTYSLLPILGTGPFAALTSNAGGGFDDFVPAPEIPPYATLILQLQAQNR
jgi:glycosidase